MFSSIKVDDLSATHKLIDVRSASEFSTGHIAGAVNVPLDEIESRHSDLPADMPLVLVCKAGTRARIAADLLAPCRSNLAVLDGGMDAWYRAGRSVVVNSRVRWSLERQVRFTAGIIVFVSVVLSFSTNVRWMFLAGFIGVGLTFAGLTDFCAMGQLLSRMPWNRRSKLRAIRDNSGESCSLTG